jgi:hypothetical protein
MANEITVLGIDLGKIGITSWGSISADSQFCARSSTERSSVHWPHRTLGASLRWNPALAPNTGAGGSPLTVTI